MDICVNFPFGTRLAHTQSGLLHVKYCARLHFGQVGVVFISPPVILEVASSGLSNQHRSSQIFGFPGYTSTPHRLLVRQLGHSLAQWATSLQPVSTASALSAQQARASTGRSFRHNSHYAKNRDPARSAADR